MRLIAGVDIGNSTTEVCVGEAAGDGSIRFLSEASRRTTGTKGTEANVHGIKAALTDAMSRAGYAVSDLELIRINEAAPVIGDTAMETITQTVITESSMIGHNPSTPAGAGQAVGYLISLEHLMQGEQGTPYIVTASAKHGYEEVAGEINRLQGVLQIEGMILQADEAVLVENRLNKKIPILDEVREIDMVPEGKLAAIEVALPGQPVRMLSNPYGIATLLELTPEETQTVIPIAKSLIGKQSAVVIKTPHGNVQENKLPAGKLFIRSDRRHVIDIDEGADRIMELLKTAGAVTDIDGEPDTNVGNMLSGIKKGMAQVSHEPEKEIRITDILAVDTLAPVEVGGALAGETCMEKAVGIAAMVKTQKLPMQQIASRLSQELGVAVKVAGVEAVMASLGALTTPGTTLPLAILDMGGGSTDAALIDENGSIRMTHQAGAGELVTMLIGTELRLTERAVAEQIKRYPLAKVESLYHIRMENGLMRFFKEAVDPRYFGHVVLLAGDEMIRIDEGIPMEKIAAVRREAKRKVFIPNAMRALSKVAPGGELRRIPNVVLVGGCAEDFEIPEMLMESLADYQIVCGRGNIRKTQGPRNAVATGLVLSHLGGN